MSNEADFTLEWRGECAYFRLTRPAKRNAITLAIVEGFERCCDELDAGRGRALIVTGEGEKAFCAGTDLSESAALGAEASQEKGLRARDVVVRIHRSPWTSISALNGLAYGGGLELALATTFRVAAPGVRLSFPEVELGALPAYGGTQLLPAMVGQGACPRSDAHRACRGSRGGSGHGPGRPYCARCCFARRRGPGSGR